ncbi:MAG: hypothetical protein HEQ38_04690 [Gemmatimonas sp.]|uniref:hypothetical protein n=1 Tax=Gemmatimonas sp. TaxID=1962908 RepID=UPI0031BE5CA1|nr:hypothetical protein [Gemmatimonas sp.]
MFVRARVGNNPYIEQAATTIALLPLELHLVAAPPFALSGDTVTIFALTSPVGRMITGFDIVAGAGGSKAWCMDAACGAVVSASASIHGSALVNGRLKTTSVAITVDWTRFRGRLTRPNFGASQASTKSGPVHTSWYHEAAQKIKKPNDKCLRAGVCPALS